MKIKRNVVISITVFFISNFLTWWCSKISFEKWQRKVGEEAIENIKTEQAICQNIVQSIWEKKQNVDALNKNNVKDLEVGNKIFIEFLDNFNNQLSILSIIINRSKFTWENIFREEARETKEFDRKLIKTITDIKMLENELKAQKKKMDLMIETNETSRDEFKRKEKEMKKIIKKLNEKNSALRRDVQISYQFKFPSDIVIQSPTTAAKILTTPKTDINTILINNKTLNEIMEEMNKK